MIQISSPRFLVICKWKRLFDSELERNGGEVILKGNLNKKDVNNLKISDPFVKEILVIWSEVFFQEMIVSEEQYIFCRHLCGKTL